MTSSFFSNTPTVTVLDNRGLQVRELAYYRHPDDPTTTQTRITRHQYDARAALRQSADSRLFARGLTNATYLTDLAGNVLRADSVDAGTTVSLNDAAGRPYLNVIGLTTDGEVDDTSQAVTRTWQYEEASLPGRPLSTMEKTPDGKTRVTERYVYAGNSHAEKALNLAGQCVRHYDPSGRVKTNSIGLTGAPLSVSRTMLKGADDINARADWQGANSSAWDYLLGGDTYTSLTTTDATGAAITTTDAKGNLQRVAVDVAGLLTGSWLTVKDGAEQAIVASVTYSAAGQKLREEHGNGVVTTYTYEPETLRLIGIKTERPSGHVSGAKVLQDLRYKYDPVGNVLNISNEAEEARFWRNQKIAPENTYSYDSLYQLVSAAGRELVSRGQQGVTLPPASIPLPTDSHTYTNYTRTYSYDEAGNLMQIQHSSPAANNSYTTNITVSERSNRGVLSTLTDDPTKVDALFTAGGQQIQLQLGKGNSLVWTPRNELRAVSPSAYNEEFYHYDGSSQRTMKVRRLMWQLWYLPGLEYRKGSNEFLQVITVGEAGRAQVRVLHWERGKPASIGNDQVRYSYDNLIGSSALEVDGDGKVISIEEYYPYGGTAVWTVRSAIEADYKTIRYSGKERDATGLYYYGYRYYQPWVGRWLSSDPAGTVDGLNLYRMVRNNPVTLKDSDGLKPINENFRESKGDLVYGLAAPRGGYISTAIGRPFIPDNKDAPASIIDLYNNTVSGQTLLSVDMNILQGFMKSPKKYEKRLSPPTNIKELVTKSRGYPLWEYYFLAGESNPKFNISAIYKEVRKSAGKTPYHEWHMTGAQAAPKLLWKRGSKLGIEMAASGAGSKIHFVLDDLDISSIVNKEGLGGQSITASELRYAYRNRERLAGKIHFYKDKTEVDAPWDTSPQLWASYKPKSKHERNEPTQLIAQRRSGSLFRSMRRILSKN